VCIAIAGDTITKTDYYTTVEEQKIFSKAFPEMVALFQQVVKGKEKQKGRKKGLLCSEFVLISYFSLYCCYICLFDYRRDIPYLKHEAQRVIIDAHFDNVVDKVSNKCFVIL